MIGEHTQLQQQDKEEEMNKSEGYKKAKVFLEEGNMALFYAMVDENFVTPDETSELLEKYGPSANTPGQLIKSWILGPR